MEKFMIRESRLPFPTKPLIIKGVKVEEYVIPDKKRFEVLKALYRFTPLPALDDEKYDLHTGKKFRVRDFRVTREGGYNLLVSPYYEEGGCTVIDWVEPDENECE